MVKNIGLIVLLLFLLIMLCFLCTNGFKSTLIRNTNDQAVRHAKLINDGVKKIKYIKMLESCFGEVKHTLTSCGIHPNGVAWHTVAYFGGYCELRMVVCIEIDYMLNEIKNIGDPTFNLGLISKIVMDGDRVYKIEYSDSKKISLKDIDTILINNGDFSVIGMKLKNEKINNFDALSTQKFNSTYIGEY